ncbi:hypothetical protein MAPG_03474 [Magnaporthiopsis poae ATCC 64411]|uniref:Uncharacterized protein n=1 Tax=Magnaporthiopsis poae (strain ATCC 64411 / 73-15) TaxID=644358 RepID=A0A0C4DU41_MAGP6|nr:hypothetical protein MAPG_03474 [Magnaporthiopsis poae ATCC 64411]
MSGSGNTHGSGSAQGTWQSVPRTWGTQVWQGAQPAVRADDATNPMDRWVTEPSVSSPFNTIAHVRQGGSTQTALAPAPAPSTNNATSGSTKQ